MDSKNDVAVLLGGVLAGQLGGLGGGGGFGPCGRGELSAKVSASASSGCRQAYAVFADYGSMSRFVPGMKKSSVISKDGGPMVVEQEGRVGLGPFSAGYKSKSEVELVADRSIRTKSVAESELKISSRASFEPDGQGCKASYAIEIGLDAGVPEILALGMGKSVAKSHMVALLSEVGRREGAKEASALAASAQR